MSKAKVKSPVRARIETIKTKKRTTMAKDETKQQSDAPAADAPSAAERKKFDQLVSDKVAAGLPKPDAEDVARRQIAEDKAAAKKW